MCQQVQLLQSQAYATVLRLGLPGYTARIARFEVSKVVWPCKPGGHVLAVLHTSLGSVFLVPWASAIHTSHASLHCVHASVQYVICSLLVIENNKGVWQLCVVASGLKLTTPCKA